LSASQAGGSVFVKAAVDEQTAGWLRAEYAIYSWVSAASWRWLQVEVTPELL
jgi:hypothetical protein